MIKTKAIDHVCLWVRSLPETKAYYEKVFAFDCHYRQEQWATLVVEGEGVHFFISEYADKNDLIKKQHISFRVDSVDDVIDQLNALKITQYDDGVSNCFNKNNYKWCEWRDPSGIRLECVELL